MVSIQIKNVPEETHEVLRRRAAAAHQSLQQYLLAKLVADAAAPTNAEIFDEIEADFERDGHSSPEISTEVILQSIREAREGL